MNVHVVDAMQRLLNRYGEPQPFSLRLDRPDSPWRRLSRYPGFVEAAIIDLATAPPAVIDRAAVTVAARITQLNREYGQDLPDQMPIASVAGYAVGVDAVMHARRHTPSSEYLAGRTLLSQAPPYESTADLVSRISDDRLRGVADQVVAHRNPQYCRLAPSMPPTGMPERSVDAINAEITRRNDDHAADLSTIAVAPWRALPGKHWIGEAIWALVPDSSAADGTERPRGRINQVGVITAIHADASPTTVSVRVAGHPTPITVAAKNARPAPSFTPVELGDEQGYITDPLRAADLLAALDAWFALDALEGKISDSGNRADYAKLADALASFTQVPTGHLLERLHRQTDVRALLNFCAQDPRMRAPGFFFHPGEQPLSVSVVLARADHPAGVGPVAAARTAPTPASPPRPSPGAGPTKASP